jgi:hypothetical protein
MENAIFLCDFQDNLRDSLENLLKKILSMMTWMIFAKIDI